QVRLKVHRSGSLDQSQGSTKINQDVFIKSPNFLYQ
ncbi:hypothetical protein VN97_g11756, partial [Penicillium thymicola]